MRTAGPTHMSAAMSLRSNSAAAQAEGRGVRLFLPHRCLAPTHRASARPYISGVSAIAPSQFDAARFVEDQKRRLEGARRSAARAANREQQARRGWGGAAVDQLARDLKAFFPRTTGFSAARHFRRSDTAPDFLAQPVREGGHKFACPRRSRALAAVDMGHVGRPGPRPSPADAGTGGAAGEHAIGRALGAIRVNGVKA